VAKEETSELRTAESPLFLSTMTAERRDRRLALTAVIISVTIFAIAAPLARLPLPRVPGFIPAYESALIISDLITAIFLFAQLAILRVRGVLVLASGYLFTALIAFAHMLTFPGAFAAAGLLGAGPQSTAWLYMFWHAAFPIAVIAYALTKEDGLGAARSGASHRHVVPLSVAGAVATVVALTLLATAGQSLLPSIMRGDSYTPAMIFIVSTVWALSAGALLALWLRRPHTVLDLWLMVVMCAWLCDIALSAVLNDGRFDLGFYAGRIYGLLAATFVLLVLLVETGALYAQLARWFAAERRGHLREMEERRLIFETSVDLIMVTDSQGNFVRVSPSSLAIVGYPPEEMTGRSAVDFVEPADLEPTRKEMRQARRGKELRNFETRYVHRDGHSVPLTWSGVWSESAQRYFFIGRDMTEHNRLVETERQMRETLSAVIDASPVAIFCLAPDRTVMMWSRAAECIFGYTAEETVGRPYNLVPEGHEAEYDHLFQQAMAGETIRDIRVQRRRKDGTLIEVSFSGAAMYGPDGTIKGVAYAFTDVTESTKIEQQLRHAQKMDAVGQLTGGVAHDFNNLLTVITSTIDILADGVADRPELAAIAKLIGEAAARGAELTSQLLSFARKQALQPREVDVNEMVLGSAKLLRPTLGENIEIQTNLDAEAWTAMIDPGQLTTAILNLAVNARDAMPHGGKLTLETANIILDEDYAAANREVTPGSYVMVAVSDTGTGIPPDIVEKVFEPFFSTKEVGKGTGLGLSMVYGFIKQSGGHVKIYSEIGIGTAIRLYLPQANASSDQQINEAAPLPVSGGDEIILLVEDDALVRTSVTTQLNNLGYQVISAANGAEALQLVDDAVEFDLLFTDVIMPGAMDGPELAKAVSKRRPGTKVLFTSGYTENAMLHQGRLDPGVLLLQKPHRREEMALMLRKALDEQVEPPRLARAAAN
jgi:PAS domain S-box-containing protein